MLGPPETIHDSIPWPWVRIRKYKRHFHAPTPAAPYYGPPTPAAPYYGHPTPTRPDTVRTAQI